MQCVGKGGNGTTIGDEWVRETVWVEKKCVARTIGRGKRRERRERREGVCGKRGRECVDR